jgi:hypothetical protein
MMSLKSSTWSLAIAAIALTLLVLAVAPAFVTSASAAIFQETTSVSCTNTGGNSPGGQQPICTGSGLTQETDSVNLNPAGNSPTGQNK